MTTTLLNKAVAQRLGLSESGVSRLRSGSRFPSLAVMQDIEAAFGWTVQDQSDAIRGNTWTSGFEEALSGYAEEHAEDDESVNA
ncbi:helix-turn-helix DNA binding domain protein [Microbacterium phage Theresita]|nr:helix-turn-helix DNA binding domain protein [Microbacterium phage Theresita]